MIQEPFAIGNSWLHRIDPRFKIVAATVLSILIALSETFPALLGAVSGAVLLLLTAQLNAGALLKRRR